MNTIKVIDVPNNFDSVKNIFDKYCNVFGIHIFATKKKPIQKVRWSDKRLADYLDNDKEGEGDSP